MDPIFESWLQAQWQEWEGFSQLTNRVNLIPLGPYPAKKLIAEFECKGLVRAPSGTIEEVSNFAIGIYFGEDHLRTVQPLNLAWVLSPENVWHPNVAGPRICLGHVSPGVGLIDLLYQTYSILSYQNFNLGDFLNPEAADWARANRSRFPVDPLPLKPRTQEVATL